MPSEVHIFSLAPFLVLLGLIAIMPLTGSRLWGNIFVKFAFSGILSLPVLVYLYLEGYLDVVFNHLLFDYIPFIILLGSLYIISGGIFISTPRSGKPHVNTIFLVTGAILASIIGTTGASMLLIRPLIRSNEPRKNKTHIIVFFIAVVANTGGLLTPLGDPALFILYLRGVPFEWFAQLLPEWGLINFLLIGLFYLIDRKSYLKENNGKLPIKPYSGFHFKMQGTLNMLWLAGIIAAISLINEKNIPSLETYPFLKYSREFIVVLMAMLSFAFTKKSNFKNNEFSWSPILEVAALFLGIFVTMTPALLYVEQHAYVFRIDSPGVVFFSTGFLSSILDNAPTAAVFHTLVTSAFADQVLIPGTGYGEVLNSLIKAIAVGAVAFGSMTYIGNGPNFMVKAIAESNGVAMPSFFGYIFRYSLIYFLPVYILVYVILLR